MPYEIRIHHLSAQSCSSNWVYCRSWCYELFGNALINDYIKFRLSNRLDKNWGSCLLADIISHSKCCNYLTFLKICLNNRQRRLILILLEQFFIYWICNNAPLIWNIVLLSRRGKTSIYIQIFALTAYHTGSEYFCNQLRLLS